jgi:hypothetical protein
MKRKGAKNQTGVFTEFAWQFDVLGVLRESDGKQDMHRYAFAVCLGFFTLTYATAQAQMRITEWMYAGANGEFVELTNLGDSPVDMRDEWYYSDSDQGEMDLDLATLGLVQPGESVIITEAEVSAFRTAWALDPTVKILGGNINSNLSRVDEINRA